jgi:hypothetical protein
MPSAFDGLPQRTDETGRLWAYTFGRWTQLQT